MEQIIDKIKAFADIPAGWNHGEGKPISSAVIDLALQFTVVALSLGLKADALPGLEGEIQIILYRKSHPVTDYIEITTCVDEEYEITRFTKNGGKWNLLWDISVDEPQVVDAISTFATFARETYPWMNSSGYYPKDILAAISVDSEALHSETMGVQFLLFNENACSIDVPQNANTLRISTLQSMNHLMSSGSSQKTFYPPIAA